MNSVVAMVLLFSLLASIATSNWLYKMKNKKWLARIAAFIVNTLILSVATILLYRIDVQTFHKQSEGLFGSLGIVVLLFFLPILTLINFYILEFVSNRRMNASK